MSWRTVIVSRRCKLDYRMNYLVMRMADETRRVFLDEIALLVLENTAISLTGALLEALTEKKVRVIFCDSRHNPMSELVPHHGSYDSTLSIKRQMSWESAAKNLAWQRIIQRKIQNQAVFLNELGHNGESDMLFEYIDEVEPGDITNREGFAAKVYFNALFGMEHTRTQETPVNAALDYGYAIILSAMNREVNAAGYLTQLGLFHDNRFNHFNLSCDLMEPYRVMIDRIVIKLAPKQFESAEKYALWRVLETPVLIDGKSQTVLNSMRIYIRSVFNAVEQNRPDSILFYEQL